MDSFPSNCHTQKLPEASYPTNRSVITSRHGLFACRITGPRRCALTIHQLTCYQWHCLISNESGKFNYKLHLGTFSSGEKNREIGRYLTGNIPGFLITAKCCFSRPAWASESWCSAKVSRLSSSSTDIRNPEFSRFTAGRN